MLRRELETKLLFDILFSSSSAIYQKLYDENVITDQFGYEFNSQTGYAFSVIGGDTKDPDVMVARLREELDAVAVQGIPEVDFERCRKKRIGSYLRLLNSPEAIANEFTKYKIKGMDLFEILPVYESITLEQLNVRFREHFNWNQMAISIVESERT